MNKSEGLDRRTAIKGIAATMAGITVSSCAFAESAKTLLQGDPDTTVSAVHRPLVVNGKRMLTVDIHAHCQVDAIWPLVKEVMAPQFGGLNPFEHSPMAEMADIPTRLSHMDAMGIDVQALSLNTTQYAPWAPRELAEQLVNIQNEALAEIAQTYPDRFVAIGAVSLQHPDLAVMQLEHAVKKLGHRGVMITASVNGVELSDPRFWPFWAKAEELDVVVFIHPDDFTAGEERFKGHGNLDNIIGNPIETTVALSHLIFEGTLDRYPGVKIVAAHGGGYLPSYIGRSDHCHLSNDRDCRGLEKKKPSDYLKQMYFDTLVFRTENLDHLIREVGAERLILGSDFPFGMMNRNAVAHVLSSQLIDDKDAEAILGGTISDLLKIDRARFLKST